MLWILLILELDSSCAVDLINKAWDTRHRYSTLIGRIHNLVNRFWQVKIVQIFKEANRSSC